MKLFVLVLVIVDVVVFRSIAIDIEDAKEKALVDR